MAEAGGVTERRREGDRRAGAPAPAGEGERRGAKPSASPLTTVLRSLGGVVVLLGVIIFTVRSMRPVYATKGTLGDELRKHAPSVATAIGAGDSTNLDRLMATQKFRDEKQNFYEDVMRLKQVDSARADSIAQYAVREAYVRGISPAIIFGVMLTENSRFVSNAKSNVGAVGLMQVYPKVWLTKEMGALLGRDIASDSTNVKYGVFILSQYFNPKVRGGGTRTENWATALLHYNGCVNGTNTPRCHSYPDKVQNFVTEKAKSICDGRGFYDCIAKPFIQGLFQGGKLAADTPKAGTDSAQGPSVPAAVVAQAAGAAAQTGGAVTQSAGTVTQSGGTVSLPPVLAAPPLGVATDSSNGTPGSTPGAGASSTAKHAESTARHAGGGSASRARAGSGSSRSKSSAKKSTSKKTSAGKSHRKH